MAKMTILGSKMPFWGHNHQNREKWLDNKCQTAQNGDFLFFFVFLIFFKKLVLVRQNRVFHSLRGLIRGFYCYLPFLRKPDRQILGSVFWRHFGFFDSIPILTG